MRNNELRQLVAGMTLDYLHKHDKILGPIAEGLADQLAPYIAGVIKDALLTTVYDPEEDPEKDALRAACQAALSYIEEHCEYTDANVDERSRVYQLLTEALKGGPRG
jgi:hypothetical protein